jgi:hypothetical protein
LTKSGFRVAALILFAALFATNLYRAATQSIVHDEALTWQLYLEGPASAIFQSYSANHHFLATILFKISTTLFGDSELALRLPTVLAGGWFFWTVFRLCALVFGDGWFFLIACAALTLNPILLDFLVAARGYGLAMAGLFWALYQMLEWMDEQSRESIARGREFQDHKRLWKAALGCCIAVATNLTFLMPVFILAAAFCFLLLSRQAVTETAAPLPSAAPKARKKSKKSKPEAARQNTHPYAPFIHFAVPVVVLAIAFLLAAPIDLARTQDFYAGSATAVKSLRDLMEASFAYGDSPGLLQGIEQISKNIALIFLPAGALAALILVSFTARRSRLELATWFSSLAVACSAILLFLAHLVSGIPYPENRTGIYFVPLATLAVLGLARMLADRAGVRHWIGLAVALVFGLFVLEFAAQWNVRSFWVWRYDADTKRIFQVLESAPKPSGPIRLGVSWTLEPSLNYYRELRKASWLMPVMRDGVDGMRQFYIATPEDQGTRLWRKLKPIYRGPVSGTAVAIQ